MCCYPTITTTTTTTTKKLLLTTLYSKKVDHQTHGGNSVKS